MLLCLIAIFTSAGLTDGLNLRHASKGTSVEGPRVPVRVYMEPGCSHCRSFMIGPLKAAMADSSTANSMDVDVNAFGNAYFAIPECSEAADPGIAVPGCGGGGGYDVGRRMCYNKLCYSGVPAQGRAKDCFAGSLVYQFSFIQMYPTQYFLCAKHLANRDWKTYVPFFICVEEAFDEIHDGQSTVNVVKKCANATNYEWSKLEACYSSDVPKTMLMQEALGTPDHPGVPYVTVDGKAMEDDIVEEPSSLISAVGSAVKLLAVGSNASSLLGKDNSISEALRAPASKRLGALQHITC